MAEYDEIRTGRHRAFPLHAHLVFATRYRHKVLTDRHPTRLEEITGAVCAHLACELVELNGQDNHVHLLVNLPPKVAIRRPVNSLKGVSSRRMRQQSPDPAKHHWRAQRP